MEKIKINQNKFHLMNIDELNTWEFVYKDYLTYTTETYNVSTEQQFIVDELEELYTMSNNNLKIINELKECIKEKNTIIQYKFKSGCNAKLPKIVSINDINYTLFIDTNDDKFYLQYKNDNNIIIDLAYDIKHSLPIKEFNELSIFDIRKKFKFIINLAVNECLDKLKELKYIIINDDNVVKSELKKELDILIQKYINSEIDGYLALTIKDCIKNFDL